MVRRHRFVESRFNLGAISRLSTCQPQTTPPRNGCTVNHRVPCTLPLASYNVAGARDWRPAPVIVGQQASGRTRKAAQPGTADDERRDRRVGESRPSPGEIVCDEFSESASPSFLLLRRDTNFRSEKKVECFPRPRWHCCAIPPHVRPLPDKKASAKLDSTRVARYIVVKFPGG